MPIRFRCFYCNQLMGISRRKAGTMVRCPTCASQVMVPHASSEPTKKETAPPRSSFFDQNDFEQIVNGPTQGTEPPPSPAPPLPEVPALPNVAPLPPVEAAPLPPAPAAPAGIVLTPLRATVLAVGVLVLVGLAFAGGLLTGKFLTGGN